jgi:hypothetical protein
MAASDWLVPVRLDQVSEPLDLIRSGRLRLSHTFSLSELFWTFGS